MAVALTRHWRVHIVGVVALLLATVGVLLYRYDMAARLAVGEREFTGWLLAAVLLGLTGLNLRKRLPRLPLLRVTNWLEVHIYLGLLAGALFIIHMGARLPTAPVNWFFLGLFVAVFLSGIAGLWLSRFAPRRLKERGEEVIYERIRPRIALLRGELMARIDADLGEDKAPRLAEYAVSRLLPFFQRPQHRLAHLFLSQHHLRRLLGDLDQLERFLTPKERQMKLEIVSLVQAKDNLDYVAAHQGLLKYWLFIHIPLTYALLLLVPVHVAWALIF